MNKRDYAQTMLSNCLCGALARYQYKIPQHWVECSRGNLCPYHMHTNGFYVDSAGTVFDPVARDYAFDEWNKMVTNFPVSSIQKGEENHYTSTRI